jgi:perosamine synthetase
MTTPIAYTRPSITDKEVAYATDAARNGWGRHCYDYIYRFEDLFKAFVGTKYVVATSSCTGALHMGLAAMGVGQGDEIIMADTNWIASAAPIVHMGAKPVFIDIRPDTWCLDPKLIERAITPRTKAILAVHLYGNMCDMDALREIGRRHNIPIIEDAAEAIGSRWNGAHAGSMGLFGTFSFHGTKTVTTGEGGMFVTNDEALYREVLCLNNHGRRPEQKKQFWADQIGFKYKISNIQAAIGCAQLERVGELIEGKRRVFSFYEKRLSGLAGITLNPTVAGVENGYWMPSVVFARDLGVTREQLQDAFAAVAIDARVFFHPLSSQPMFTSQPENHNAYDIPTRALNLPSYHDMTDEDLDRVVGVVERVYASARSRKSGNG